MSSRRLLYKNHKTWVEVCKKALRNNARIVRGLLQPENKLMAVVKSNAYGHGLVETASLLSKNSDWLGVDNLDEAILLRQDNIKSPILVMGYTPAERFQEAIAHDLRLTIYDTAGLKNIFLLFNPNQKKKAAYPNLDAKYENLVDVNMFHNPPPPVLTP